MKINTRRELLNEIRTLPSSLTKDVLDFVCFIKVRQVIDPKQAYFWTKKWQQMEKEASEDIKLGRVRKYHSLKEFKSKMGA